MKTAGNELVITSFASEIGKSEESIAISKNNDKDITISYSANEINSISFLEEIILSSLLNTLLSFIPIIYPW